jgi:hypothetical protein
VTVCGSSFDYLYFTHKKKMADCPNCNSKLPFLKVGFLSKINNKVRCKNCNIILKGDESLASTTGMLGAALSIIILNIWREEFFSNPMVFVTILFIVATIFFLIATFQYKNIDLKVVEDQDQVLEYEQFSKMSQAPDLPENPTFVDKLKQKHFHKTDDQLLRIINNPKMVDEAHRAAKELLDERSEKT